MGTLNSSDTFAVNPWSQNNTTVQGWPFNYIDYPEPDFFLQTDPCSHTKTFVYSDKSPAQGSAWAVLTAGSGPVNTFYARSAA